MKLFLTLFFIFLNICIFAQDFQNDTIQQSKIDSVFNFYFKALEIELTPSPIDSHFYIMSIDSIKKDTIYYNRYASDALNFFEKITKINAPIKYGDYSPRKYVNEEILTDWKKWYLKNRDLLFWDRKKHIVFRKDLKK